MRMYDADLTGIGQLHVVMCAGSPTKRQSRREDDASDQQRDAWVKVESPAAVQEPDNQTSRNDTNIAEPNDQ